MTIYSNGFIVGNSEFRDIKDPKNLQFLNDLKKGYRNTTAAWNQRAFMCDRTKRSTRPVMRAHERSAHPLLLSLLLLLLRVQRGSR